MQKRFALLAAGLGLATALAAQTYKLPAYEKFVLPNGLTVYLMEHHEVPMISVSMVVDGGAVHDPEGKSGLAAATAEALRFGAGARSKAQLDEELDFTGASLVTFAGKESAGLRASFAAKDQALVFSILKDLLIAPQFDPTELTNYLARTRDELGQAKESPRSVIGSYWNAFLYAGHPYAKPTGGTPEGLGAITRADVAAFYAARYRAGSSAIAIVGDFKLADMKRQVTEWLGGWKTPKPEKATYGAPALSSDGARVLLVDKPDARETTFYIGGKGGVHYTSPDYVSLSVINTVLGGRFTSWLNDQLRVNSGLTYGARSQFATYHLGSTFQISTFTKVSSTEAAIDLALVVLDSLHRVGIDETTLKSAQNYVKGDFPTNYETASQLSALLTSFFELGYNEAFINSFQQQVDGLTVARCRELVAKYIPRDKLQFVLIGKAEAIGELAKKYGTVTQKPIAESGF